MSLFPRSRRLSLGRLAILGALAAGSVGCRSDPMRNSAPRTNGTGVEWKSTKSTLGSDLLRAPRGQGIDPPSIGVDLVKQSTLADPAATLTSLSRLSQGAPGQSR